MKVDKDLWQKKKLSDFFELQMGKTPSRKDLSLWEDGDTPWVSISDMKDNRLISDAKESLSLATISQYRIPIIPIGTVIMSFKLTIGKTCIVAKPLVTNEAIMAFYPKKGVEVNSSFLAYALSALKWKGNRAVKGITINKKTISDKIFSLPPLDQQEAIASELDALQEVVDGYKAQIADLDTLAQSIFFDTFGDPIANSKGWEVKNILSFVSEITSSKRIFAGEYTNTGVPFYRIKEVIEKANQCPISLELFISKERYNEIKNSFGVPKINDILVTAVGSIGEIWIVDNDNPFYFKDGNIIWLKTNPDSTPIYIKESLRHILSHIKGEMNGAAYSALTIIKLKGINMPFPPQLLQKHFASQVDSLNQQKELLRQQLADAEMMMAERMQYYFS